MRILLIEDDSVISSAVEEALVLTHYAVDAVADGDSAHELAMVNPYDVIILDWGIPGRDGIDLLRSWRAEGVSTPILMLTGRTDVEDRVDGLDSGADDYLTKPFSVAELLARVRSLLRRREKSLQVELVAGDLVMDAAAREVTVDGRAIALSPKEFALLEYLLRHQGEVVSRAEISDHVWDDAFDSMSNVIDVTVHRLRRKIDGDRAALLLHTVKGAGYILKPERQRA